MLTPDELKVLAIEFAAALPPAYCAACGQPAGRSQPAVTPTATGSTADYDDTFLAAVDLEKAEAVLQTIMDGGELPGSMRTVLIVVRDHVDAAMARLKGSAGR